MTKNIDYINKLKSDKRIIDIIKEPLIDSNLDNKEYVSKLQVDLLASYMSIIKSIELISSEYKPLYLNKENLYTKILKAANHYKELNILWININDDSRIVNGISKIIALWLSADIDAKGRAKLFTEITEEIKSNNIKDILRSIEILKNEYTLIYKYNESYFLNIKKQLANPDEYKDLTFKSQENGVAVKKKNRNRFSIFGNK